MKKEHFEYDVIIITGGSSGIGREFIKSIFNINPHIKVCNLSRSNPSSFFSNLPLTHIPCDLSNEQSFSNAINDLHILLNTDHWQGRVLLINNSGFGGYGKFQNLDLANEINMIHVNLLAPVRLTGELLPIIIKRGGAIINIASLAAFQPTPFMATYGSTKAFLLNWSMALTEDLRPLNIKVLAVCPGPTESMFYKRAGFDQMGNRQSVQSVVQESLHALICGKSFVVNGFRHKLLACLVRKLPLSFIGRISGYIMQKVRSTERNSFWKNL